jgi:hypothetical protein
VVQRLSKVGSRVGAAVAVATAACLLGAAGASAATPRLLVHGRHISSIDANTGSLVWRADSPRASNGGSCASVIRRRAWASSAVRVLFRCDPRNEGDSSGQMAMGSSAVLFSRIYVEGQGCCDTEFRTNLRTIPTPAIDSSFHHFGCGGDDILGVAARGSIGVYGKVEWTSSSCPGNPSTGTETLTGGGLFTIALPSGQPRSLAGTPPAGLLGVSPTRVALVPYDLSNPPVNDLPGTLPQIQVWNLATRSLERTIPETGAITALQIRGDQLAVLVDHAGSSRIDRFSASTGAAEGSRLLVSQAQPMLALDRQWVVYVVGKKIVALNTNTHAVHVVARPTYAPAQILAMRGQVVWTARGDRILALPLA